MAATIRRMGRGMRWRISSRSAVVNPTSQMTITYNKPMMLEIKTSDPQLTTRMYCFAQKIVMTNTIVDMAPGTIGRKNV